MRGQQVHELRILPRPDQATPRQVWAGAVAVAAWSAAWIACAVLVAWNVYHLDRWADILQTTAGSLHKSASALSPLVGRGGAVAELRHLSSQAGASAAAVRSSMHQTAYLLGAAIGLVPTLPAAILYGQFYRSRRKERRALVDALRDPAGRQAVLRFLAERAIDEGSLDELLRTSSGRRGGAAPPYPGDEDMMLLLAGLHAVRLGLPADLVPAPRPARR